jgi:hypothetical protein
MQLQIEGGLATQARPWQETSLRLCDSGAACFRLWVNIEIFVGISLDSIIVERSNCPFFFAFHNHLNLNLLIDIP